MVGVITTLLVVTVAMLDNPTHPELPDVILAWKVEPKIEEIVVVATGPLMPYPNH